MKIQRRTRNGWEDRGSFDGSATPSRQSRIVEEVAKRWAKYWEERDKRIETLSDSKLKAAAKLNIR